jgi:hypothetical protein
MIFASSTRVFGVDSTKDFRIQDAVTSMVDLEKSKV